MNLRDRRDRAAARHAREMAALAWELESVKLHNQLLSMRVRDLTNSDPYKAGFGDGVTVSLQQLQMWLIDCRASAKQVIAAMPVDHVNPDFKQGHDVAWAWIDEAIENLGNTLEGRAHEAALG